MVYVILTLMSLSYTTTPFHPTISYTGQVQAELGLANNNFTTLAQAFINNDPTSLTVVYSINSLTVGGYTVSATPTPNTLLPLNANAQFPASVIPPGIGNAYANPVNLNSATADYLLQVGQVAYISFSGATSVPLHIATTNGTYYELHLVCSNSSGINSYISLNPNNTSYNNAFSYMQYYVGSAAGNNVEIHSAFEIGAGNVNSTVYISNVTTLKIVRSLELDVESGSYYLRVSANLWNDTTTS